MNDNMKEIPRRLAEPFDRTEVKWKPATVSGNRALAIAYVDARVIQDRLDLVLGPLDWQDDYDCLSCGSVVCRLRLRLGREWVTKVDVGSPSEQPDAGDRLKAAFSDALKRAAIKFGIGRYLYRLPSQWVDYDPQKRQFARQPVLPDFALPKKEGQAAEAQPPGKKTQANGQARALPASGAELLRRLQDYDAKLAGKGLCQPGALVKHVAAAGAKAGYPPDIATWEGPAIQLAVDETKVFEAGLREARRQAQAGTPTPRPDDSGRDQAEVLAGEGMAPFRAYLDWLVASRGFRLAMLLQRFGVSQAEELTVANYRFALAELAKLKPKAKVA